MMAVFSPKNGENRKNVIITSNPDPETIIFGERLKCGLPSLTNLANNVILG
jgi:hypothetical protein